MLRRSPTRLIRLACALCACAAFGPRSFAASDVEVSRADELKAAYLFNFAKLIEWPANVPGDELTFCFMGAAGVRDAFVRSVADKKLGARKIVVHAGEEVPRSDCEVLYVEGRLATSRAVFDAAGSPTLTVSDAEGFAAHGGMVELFSEGNRLRFNINLEGAQHAGLRISSSLLQLAAQVVKESAR